MFNYRKEFYSDVRTEKRYETLITYKNGALTEKREKQVDGAFIRVYDGNRWYYSATYDIGDIQNELDRLYSLASPHSIENITKRLEVNKDKFSVCKKCVKNVLIEDKDALLIELNELASKSPDVKNYTSFYKDRYSEYRFTSSLGADLDYDYQSCGIKLSFTVCEGEKAFSEDFVKCSVDFDDLAGHALAASELIKESVDFTQNAVPVEKGLYEVILAPAVAGVFAHESFGHKSEADLMASDETMKEEWKLGDKVASDIVSIVDYGGIEGISYIKYDDEGTGAKKNYLIKDGILSGRLHCSQTSDIFDEGVTGNARAMNVDFEPIVRMTNTYFEAGTHTLEQLISEVKSGYFIKEHKHGSGMSTFTIAPSLCYEIKDGKIGRPVRISVITGDVFSTLNKINGLSDKIELHAKCFGGCGKMEQYPLTIGYGGPYVRVSEINVM